MTNQIEQLIIKDHDTVRSLYQKYCESNDIQERRQLVAILGNEIILHTKAEQQVLYPAMEKHIKDGIKITRSSIREHEQVLQGLQKMHSLNGNDEEVNDLLQQVMQDVGAHMKHEEQHDLPSLVNSVGHQLLQEMASEFTTYKTLSPLRERH